ncbi:MAG: DUF305 domain-containing protein [Halobacteriovoraceae bacterium]|nr:DUF305 domain-containing protein [Halobacteriovoraceae bacterium]|tara:strand:- start:2629 stop:3183 length:555 start_codon:yes stop_codon:yes gene_type:complete
MTMGNYTKFFLMIFTAMIAMFGINYLNSYAISHVHWSETRFYMVFVMGSAMAVIMLAFMKDMYKNKLVNNYIYSGSVLIFLISIGLVRSQFTVSDTSWMNAMIPHHSIAILTSERAQIKDIRVKELANNIIKAQRKEIKEMEWLLKDIGQNGEVESKRTLVGREVPKFEGNLKSQDSFENILSE